MGLFYFRLEAVDFKGSEKKCFNPRRWGFFISGGGRRIDRLLAGNGWFQSP